MGFLRVWRDVFVEARNGPVRVLGKVLVSVVGDLLLSHAV